MQVPMIITKKSHCNSRFADNNYTRKNYCKYPTNDNFNTGLCTIFVFIVTVYACEGDL